MRGSGGSTSEVDASFSDILKNLKDGRNAFDWDMTIHGPIVGVKISF